jgi:mannose-6-phosphate isomerase
VQPGGTVADLFPAAADEFFAARRVRCTGTMTLDAAGFAVLVVTGGSGRIVWDDGDAAVACGDTWVVPSAAGLLRFSGELEAIVCLPPRHGAMAR